MKRVIWAMALTAIVASVAVAQTSHLGGGVFIAHYVSELTYTEVPVDEVACADYVGYSIDSAADQINRIDGVADGTLALWFVLSAWTEDKEFCGVQFGFGDYDSGQFTVTEHGVCASGDPQEIPQAGWPGPNTGTAIVATDSAWVGNYVPVYYFGGYAYDGTTVIPLAEDPSQITPFGGWASCDQPQPYKWAATVFGAMGINGDGTAAEPTAVETHACCVQSTCLMRTEDECTAMGGEFLPEIDSCDPDPCAGPPLHVCCDGSVCFLITEDECTTMGGDWYPEWDTCEPNPCVEPAVERSSWGTIKATYR
ncbi:MAG: hypothetical protein KAY24_13230 [Candidatus Eisenbacteria sp.]|nr:hypothetical protein [Candidatus Eisenbacteria bacterium]